MRSCRYLIWFVLFTFGINMISLAQDTTTEKASKAAGTEQAEDEDKSTSESDASSEAASSEQDAEEEDSGEEPEDAAAGGKEDESAEKPPAPIKLRCHFVGEDEYVVVVRPLEWSSFPILDVVPHGTQVSRGDTLIAFDARKLDVAIEDAQSDIEMARLSLEQEESQLSLTQRSLQMALAAAERAERIASEDLKRFLTQGRDDRVTSLERSVKSAENRFAYAQEEYNQLKKMYEADDLTEDTEEIILRRTRDSMESSEYSLDRFRKSREQGMTVDLPRSEENLEEALRKATLALERARITTPVKMEQSELALAKKQVDLRRKELRLERLQRDRELMEITAPISGWVYYGRHKQGKWSDSGQIEAILRKGLNVKANQTLMTVVNDGKLSLRGVIAEKDLERIRVGSEGNVKPTAAPGLELSATVTDISDIPISDGKFQLALELADIPEEATLRPGMTCEVSFQPTP